MIAGVVLAPLSTLLFQMQNTPEGAGMGTAGFAGQIITFTAMDFEMDVLFYVIILHFAGPGVICFLLSEYLRKTELIKPGDMRLKNE